MKPNPIERNTMFKKHSLNVQLVKTPKHNDAPEEAANKLTPEQFSHVVKEQCKNAALLIGATYITKVVFDTVQEVVLHIVKTKIR
jgi:hypothetical protein